MMSIRFPILVSVLIAVGACAGSKPSVPAPSPEPEFTPQEVDLANSNYVRGLVAYQLGDFEEALDLLSLAYLRLPQHAGVNFALADAYIQTADLVNAAYYARQAVRIDPKNRYYHLKVAEIHLRSGQNSAMVDVLKNALVHFPGDPEFTYLLANAYFEQGKYRESNQMYDVLIKRDPSDVSLRFHKVRNYNALSQPDSAISQIRQVRRIEPGNLNAIQALAAIYSRTGDTGAAVELYRDVLTLYPDRNELKIALTDLHITRGEWTEAGALLDQVIRSENVVAAAKAELVQFVLARFNQDPANQGLRDMTTLIVETFSAISPDNAMAQALAADYYAAIDDRGNALLKLESTLRLSPDNAPAWRQRLQLLYESERYADIVALADSAETHAPEDAFVRFFIGIAYFIDKENEKAVEWLTLASQSPARPPFRSVILGTLADATYQLGRWEAAKRHYEEALRLNPDNDTALNNYAYYMSLKGERLEDAKRMSERSLKLSPGNPSFLDTYGWIHYLMGDYQTALTYISASIENGSQSAEVHEHKGDVLFKLDRGPEAVEFWRKALELDPKRRYLIERIDLATP